MVGGFVDPLGVMQAARIETLARLVEELMREADQLTQWSAEVMGDRIKQRLQFRCGSAERCTTFSESAFQVASLTRDLLPESSLLNCNGQRRRHLERDIPVLGIEGRGCR